MGGQVIEESAIEIDESQLEKGEQWNGARFLNSNRVPFSGVQRQVTA